MLNAGDSLRVAELMRETAAAEILPRFRKLSKGDIRHKRPGDVVTVADEVAEQRLASGLARILPGVPVVGEEAVENDPSLLDLIRRPGEACWIVDPLDGTSNFAAGRERFAMIVCLVENAAAKAGWILDVPRGRLAVARQGGGVTLDGAAVRCGSPAQPPAGFVGYKVAKEFDRQLDGRQRAWLGSVKTLGCAGIEYLEILSGNANFSLYRITKPWDHAAGSLMMIEAGGSAVQFDGSPYSPAQALNGGLIVATSTDVMAEVRAAFDAIRMPLLAPRA